LILDCRNLDCPKPVIMTKEAWESLEDDDFLEILLNSYSSVENVKRFAKKQGIYFELKKDGKDTKITFVKGYECGLEPKEQKKPLYLLIIGSIISALIASSCCLAPFLFLVFGVSVSSLSFLQVFTPYKWLFIGVAAAILAYLWFDYFKSRKTKLVCDTWLSRNYSKLLIGATIIVAIFISYPYWVGYLIEN